MWCNQGINILFRCAVNNAMSETTLRKHAKREKKNFFSLNNTDLEALIKAYMSPEKSNIVICEQPYLELTV